MSDPSKANHAELCIRTKDKYEPVVTLPDEQVSQEEAIQESLRQISASIMNTLQLSLRTLGTTADQEAAVHESLSKRLRSDQDPEGLDVALILGAMQCLKQDTNHQDLGGLDPDTIIRRQAYKIENAEAYSNMMEEFAKICIVDADRAQLAQAHSEEKARQFKEEKDKAGWERDATKGRLKTEQQARAAANREFERTREENRRKDLIISRLLAKHPEDNTPDIMEASIAGAMQETSVGVKRKASSEVLCEKHLLGQCPRRKGRCMWKHLESEELEAARRTNTDVGESGFTTLEMVGRGSSSK